MERTPTLIALIKKSLTGHVIVLTWPKNVHNYDLIA